MMEMMGLHMPGSSFVNPGTKLRQELTRAAVHQVTENGWVKENYRPLGKLRDGDMVRVSAETGELQHWLMKAFGMPVSRPMRRQPPLVQAVNFLLCCVVIPTPRKKADQQCSPRQDSKSCKRLLLLI